MLFFILLRKGCDTSTMTRLKTQLWRCLGVSHHNSVVPNTKKVKGKKQERGKGRSLCGGILALSRS
jgi:hypothetical protein